MMLGMSSCIPAHLDKYRKKDNSPVNAQNNKTLNDDRAGDASAFAFNKNLSKPDLARVPANNADNSIQQKATIYAVDSQTFRFALKDEDVWDSAIQVLLKNYNVTVIDHTSGVLTTEWDTYYLDNSVFRNKISMHLRRVGRDVAEITMRNNVEKLQDGAVAGTVGAVWLPAEDTQGEVGRVIQNMALALNQPPPVLPPTMVAKRANAPEVAQ